MLSLPVMGKRRADPGCGQLSIAERVVGRKYGCCSGR